MSWRPICSEYDSIGLPLVVSFYLAASLTVLELLRPTSPCSKPEELTLTKRCSEEQEQQHINGDDYDE